MFRLQHTYPVAPLAPWQPAPRTRRAPLPNALFTIVVEFLQRAQFWELAEGLEDFPESMQGILWTALFAQQYSNISRLARQLLFQHRFQQHIIERIQSQFYAVTYALPVNLCQRLEGHRAKVTCLTTTAAGLLASGSANGTIRLWNAEGKSIRVLKGHCGRVTCLAPTPDGGLASGSDDGTIRRWDTVREIQAFSSRRQTVNCLVARADGTLVSGGSKEGDLCLWSPNGQLLRVITGHDQTVNCLTLLPNGRVASGADDRHIRVWSINFKTSTVLSGHTARVTALIVLRNGLLVSGSDDGKIRQWNLNTGRVRVILGHRTAVASLASLYDGRFAAGSTDAPSGRCVQLWTSEGCESSQVVFDGARVHCMTELLGGKLAVACDIPQNKKNIFILNAKMPDPVDFVNLAIERANRDPEDRFPVDCITQLHDGRIVSGTRQPRLHLWSEEGDPISEFIEHESSILCLTPLSVSDYVLASGSTDRTIRLWNRHLTAVLVLAGHSDPVICLTVTEEPRLISGTCDQIWVWAFIGADMPVRLAVIDQGATCLTSWADMGFASGSWDGSIHFWSSHALPTGAVMSHTARVTCLATAQDGTLVSGSGDGTVRIRGLNFVHPHAVTCLSIDDQGFIATGTQDNQILFWNGDGSDSGADPIQLDEQLLCLQLLNNGRLVIGTDKGLRAGHLVENPSPSTGTD